MFGRAETYSKMADFVRIAIGRLLHCGYSLYIPLQRPLFDELIILERGRFSRCIIKPCVLCKNRGPTLNTKFVLDYHEIIFSDLNIDCIIAVLSCRSQVWIVPLVAIGEVTTLRLGGRPDWLVGQVQEEQLDPSTRLQRRKERELVIEADTERSFYEKILNSREEENVAST